MHCLWVVFVEDLVPAETKMVSMSINPSEVEIKSDVP